MLRTHDRAAVDVAWFLRNLAKLMAVLMVGFILASASNPDTLPDDLGRAINTLLGNALFSFVFIGAVVMVPMGLLYLVLLALVVRRWTPIRQRIAALVLSPLVTGPVLLAFTWNTLEGVLFGLGSPSSMASSSRSRVRGTTGSRSRCQDQPALIGLSAFHVIWAGQLRILRGT